MQKIHGIYTTSEGTIEWCTVGLSMKGPQVLNTRTWDGQSLFKKPILLDKGIYAGIPSNWIRTNSQNPDNTSRALCKEDDPFVPCAAQAIIDLHKEEYRNNILASVPDDAYLCTVPLALLEDTVPSFIAVHSDGTIIRFGVVIDKVLKAVFVFPDSDETKRMGYFGRIERYWNAVFDSVPFPISIYTLGTDFNLSDSCYDVIQVSLSESLQTENTLKAAGVALCNLFEGCVPVYHGVSKEFKYRRIRTFALFSSIMLIGVALIISGLFLGLDFRYNIAMDKTSAQYSNLLMDNPEVKILLKKGDSLSVVVSKLQKMVSHPTQWSRFTQALGEKKPKGLYFERLGSEPVSGSSNFVRVALVGWAESETVVTDFMKTMQSLPFVKEASLASLDREGDRKTICQFKVLCTVKLENE